MVVRTAVGSIGGSVSVGYYLPTQPCVFQRCFRLWWKHSGGVVARCVKAW